MIWIRVFLLAVMLLYSVYYCMLVLQLNNLIKFTNRKFTFSRCIIPFYYWIAPQEEKKNVKKTNKKTKNN